jgi:hypothetical protein
VNFLSRYGLIPLSTLLLIPAACNEATVAPQSAVGDGTVRVTVFEYNEFFAAPPHSAPVSLTLKAADRVWQGIIPIGDSTFFFEYLPYQGYILVARREGAYTFENVTTVGTQGLGAEDWVFLHQLPPPSYRIDSIQFSAGVLRLVTADPSPPATLREIVVFTGPSPAVSPRLGTYTKDFYAIEMPGSREAFVKFGPQTGSRVYVTARLMTGGTKSYYDTATSTGVYTNLEENTTVVAVINGP